MSEVPDQSPSVDVDRLLQQADPEFHASLEAVRAVENAADVHIEASVLDIEGGDEDGFERATKDEPSPSRRITLKALPADLFGYARSQLRSGLHAFRAMTVGQKLLFVGLILIAGLTVYLGLANLRGTWLPRLNAPVLTGFGKYADHVESIGKDEEWVSLAAEFPPDVHEYLFKPFKVNLRATAENPQPMGAFEFVVTLDAKETAIEARDREVEMVDLIQRVFEDESVHDLATELGKGRLKSRILREINAKLSQGRVTDVHFKTFVLKP